MFLLSSAIYFSDVLSAAVVNVKRPNNLACHATEMKKALLETNRGQNITIELEVFCHGGAVKYTSGGPSGFTTQFVPPGHVIYEICGNPCSRFSQ